MNSENGRPVSRREVLVASAAFAVTTLTPALQVRAAAARTFEITASPGRTRLVGGKYPATDVWSYNGSVPGPMIRARQGERIRVSVTNRLGEETTVHWHGLRVPNAMDGVPHLTQKPISAGATFTYEFDLPDAGTYWYHPHQRSFEQVGRGLYGPLVVEERTPITIDRNVVWVIDDWRLKRDARIADGFGNMMDVSHAGRTGNTVTINGRLPTTFAARRGERIRLRIINAANARIFGLQFTGHRPKVIALDGQPVTPHEPAGGRVVIGPAMRVDLVIDMMGQAGQRYVVEDRFYFGREYRFVEIAYDAKLFRELALDTPIELAANTMPEPVIDRAERHTVSFGGGMMGGMTMARMDGREVDMREMMHKGKAWAINGVAATGHIMEPLLTLRRGRSYVLELKNETAFPHPIHLHGHSFRVLSRDGKPTRHREWQDTVLMGPRERVEIAFVADNPGDSMFYCHILEHQAGGMMGVIRVTKEGKRT